MVVNRTMRMTRTGRMGIVALSGLLALLGCGPKMMPTPTVFRTGEVDPFLALPDEFKSNEIEVFFATDRMPKSNPPGPGASYGPRSGDVLRLGRAKVRFGSADSDWETIRHRSLDDRHLGLTVSSVEEFGKLWTTIPQTDPEFMLAHASVFGDDQIRRPANEFIEAINERLAKTESKQVLIYVAGFNTKFADTTQQIAQAVHFMGRDVVGIAYSWPVHTHPFKYCADRRLGGLTVRHLRELIQLLSERSDAKSINILSFSAGGPIVSDAILQLRLMHAASDLEHLRSSLKIGRVIYVAADEDLTYFRNMYLDGFDDLPQRILVYTSRIDRGLALSRTFKYSTTRLGRPMAGLSEADLEDLRESGETSYIDVTGAIRTAGSGDIYGHSYWYGNPWVSTDLIAAVRYGLTPEQRALEWNEEIAHWYFPKDYPTRIRAIFKELQSPSASESR